MNQCPRDGETVCSSGTGNSYATCGNYDTDTCFEWSGTTPCKSTEACSDGKCVAVTQPTTQTTTPVQPPVQPTVVQPVSPGTQPTTQTTPPVTSCEDSDIGRSVYVRGKTVGLYSYQKLKGWIFGEDSNKASSRTDSTLDHSIYYDQCFNSATSNQLNEGFCQDNIMQSTSVICPNGCKNGACALDCKLGQKVGDVDGDGRVTARDSSITSEILLGLATPPTNTCCVDANKDKKINILDVGTINQIINTQTQPTLC